VAYRRPDYTEKALQALRRCTGLDDFDHFSIFVDPGFPEVIRVCGDWASRFPINAMVHVNEAHLGVAENPFRAYSHVFDRLNSDFNVAIEDDAVLSVDALKLALCYFQHESSATSRYSFLNLCDHYDYRGNGKNIGNVPEDPSLLAESTNLSSPFAWCFARHQWPFIQNNWDKNVGGLRGWDWSIRFAMRMEGKVALTPVLSRCQNIGERGGVHEDGTTFHYQLGLRYSDGTYRGPFKVVNRITPDESRRLEPWMVLELPRYFAARPEEMGILRGQRSEIVVATL